MQIASLAPAALPDPASPTAIPFAAVLGGFIGAAIARWQGRDRGGMRESAEDFGFVLTGFALAAYLLGLTTNLY